MKTKFLFIILLFSFVGLTAQQKEGAKLQQANEKGFIEVDKVPALKFQLKPAYPDIARLAGIEGTVYLKLLIDEKGNVAKAKVEQGVKDMLDNAALEAAKKAKFSPAMLNNKPVKVWVLLPVSFKLDVSKKEEAKVMKYNELDRSSANKKDEEPDTNSFTPVEKYPEMIESVTPEYPELAKKTGIVGKVFVKVLVDKEGSPKRAVVLKSENEILNQASIDAAMKTKFSPAMQKGEPIAIWIVLPYKFALADKKDPNENLPHVSLMVSSIDTGYPAEAFANKIEGTANLKVMLDQNKNIQQIELIESSQNESLDKAANEYVKKNIDKIISGYESVSQEYYKRRPQGVKEPVKIKDLVVIGIIFKIKE
jgi:TonB family protein